MNRRSALWISLLLALGVGAIVAAIIATNDNVDDVSVDSNPAIVELIPPRGDTILPQSNVGVILASIFLYFHDFFGIDVCIDLFIDF